MTQIKKTAQADEEFLILEQRKVKALEKIANSLDALTVWFEEIDKDEWSNRVQYYLAEFHNKIVKGSDVNQEDVPAPKKTTSRK
jgi:hypothetical protein